MILSPFGKYILSCMNKFAKVKGYMKDKAGMAWEDKAGIAGMA